MSWRISTGVFLTLCASLRLVHGYWIHGRPFYALLTLPAVTVRQDLQVWHEEREAKTKRWFDSIQRWFGLTRVRALYAVVSGSMMRSNNVDAGDAYAIQLRDGTLIHVEHEPLHPPVTVQTPQDLQYRNVTMIGSIESIHPYHYFVLRRPRFPWQSWILSGLDVRALTQLYWTNWRRILWQSGAFMLSASVVFISEIMHRKR